MTPTIDSAVRSNSSHLTQSIDAQGLLERVRALAPIVRAHSDEAENNRRLSKEVIHALAEAGLFRMFLPRALGGLEVDPVTYCEVAEELARVDTAAGWILQAGNQGAWWTARMPQEGAETVYRENPSALVAAAFHPPQQAVEVEAGYRITGRGPLASNIHDAEWLFLSAIVMDGGQPKMTNGMPEVRGVTLRASDVQIVDTWHSLGMRGTDSNDVVMDNVFVPAALTFPLVPEVAPNPHFLGPLYRFPGIGAASTIAAPVALAIAREAINELRALATKKTAFGFMKPLRERSAVQIAVARSEALLRSARLLFYDTLGAAWARALAGSRSTLEQNADLLLAGVHAVSTGAKVTDMVHRLAGTTGIYQRNRLERLYRDMSTVRHHGFVSENRLEAVGQVYLGLPPEFGMVAF
jgi:indole-3-acetate monooxygenase